MPEFCMKCRKELSKCTCYVCPRCFIALNETDDGMGICPICNTQFELSADSNGTSSFFFTFKNLLRDNLPLDKIKETFTEEMVKASRRVIIKSLGGVPKEDISEDIKEDVPLVARQSTSVKEDEDEDEGEIEIEGFIDTVKCPICNVYIAITDVKNHSCFNK